MSGAALFIDLSNFYSHLLKSGIEEPRFLRDYLLYWLDFDLFAEALWHSVSGIWIFYSGKRIGPSDERIEGKYLRQFIDRINAIRGVTARDVNIPSEQREHLTVKCESCGREHTAEWKSEKGIDASLIVHLFDTMDSWDVAYLLSGDADFVPAVVSLRRRGKIVIGAGFPARSSALVRECYDYIDLCNVYLKEDVAAYGLFRESVQLFFTHQRGVNDDHFYINLVLQKGLIDLSSRHSKIEEFKTKFPDQVRAMDLEKAHYQFRISPIVWAGVERRIESFVSSIEGLEYVSGRRGSYKIEYVYDRDARTYEVVELPEIATGNDQQAH